MKSVSEVCRETGVTRKTLFYYDRIGLFQPTCRLGKQHAKAYSEEAVEELKHILKYRRIGLSVSEIREIKAHPEHAAAIVEQAIKRMEHEKKDLEQKLLCAREALIELKLNH